MSSRDDSCQGLSHEDSHSHRDDHTHDESARRRDKQDHGHAHGHNHGGRAHGHTHGTIDASITATERGLWAIKWSFLGLFATTLFQIVIFYFSNSIALLADTIHNLGDACTAIPLWLAFALGRRKPNKQFTYGYGRVEDLAGIVVVVTIFASAAWAGYESVNRFFHPQPVSHLWAVAIAAIVGFLGNEVVAIFRIKVGKEMGSAALSADGYHARVDGFASLSVLLSAVGLWLGYPLADPVIGIFMTLLILRIVWESAVAVFTRVLDGVDPNVVETIRHEAKHVAGVKDVSEVRVRWLGHRLHAELNVAVDQGLSVEQGHSIATQVRHDLLHTLQFLSNAIIHVDPANVSGEQHHQIAEHEHDGKPGHSHP